jgi:hypothetical protein
MRRRFFCIVGGALLFSTPLLVGCGKSDGRMQVTGTLKYEDGTVPKGASPAVVRFEPEDPNAPNVRPATGYPNAETGEFELYCVKPGDGAYPGKYKVTLMVNSLYPPRPNGIMVPQEYTNVETTPLSYEISSANHHFDLKVPKRDPKKDTSKKKR